MADDLTPQPEPRTSGSAADRLARLDAWMASHPWHPRIVPWVLYLVLLTAVLYLTPWWPPIYPVLYTGQCVLVVWFLWRYRKLTPELNLRFHPIAVPVGVGVAVLWIWMGLGMIRLFPGQFDDVGAEPFFAADQMGPAVGWVAFVLRLVGMSLVVPLFEELFNRSLLLRCLHRPGRTWLALIQVLQDMPAIGDWLMDTRIGARADAEPPILRTELERTPFGKLSVFGVCASSAVFVAAHQPRDWPACFLCGVIYCLVVGLTRTRGLGPVIWTHGITNAALWGYTLYSGDWRFL